MTQRGGRRVAVRRQDDAQVDRDWARRRHQRSQLSQLGQTTQCIEATGAAQSLQLGGAQDLRQGGLAMGFVSGDRKRRRSCLLRGQHKHGRSRRLQQQQAPPDMRTSQSAKACLRREVPTDHEARGQAQRRQLRRVATELRRDRDPEAEAKHAKHVASVLRLAA